MVELSVGGDSGLNVVDGLAKASSLSSLAMMYNGNTLFSSASCIAELAFD